MTLPIERDLQRFNRIVKGHVRKNLRKYMSDKEMIGRRGKDVVSIPVPQIELPYFRFGGPGGGAGQGEGEEGEIIGRGQPGKGKGGGAGNQPGGHILEVEITLEELAEILGEELELPRIQPKLNNNVQGEVFKYTGARRVGPESLRYMKRTYMAALKRSIIMGLYDPDDPVLVPIPDDKRYRSWKNYPQPQTNAVVFYMMDVSGSMTDEKKRLARLTAFWIDIWLQSHYKNIIIRYLAHDTQAAEVDQDTFYRLRQGGGTNISSAYELCHRLITREYDPAGWNLYGFHFSDGENFTTDNDKALDSLENRLLPLLNMFCFGQLKSWFALSSSWMGKVNNIEADNILTASIVEDEDIYTAIKIYLGKGL